VRGLILNIESLSWMCTRRSRHWIALPKIDGRFYNLDSNLPTPQPFADNDAVRPVEAREFVALDPPHTHSLTLVTSLVGSIR